MGVDAFLCLHTSSAYVQANRAAASLSLAIRFILQYLEVRHTALQFWNVQKEHCLGCCYADTPIPTSITRKIFLPHPSHPGVESLT